MVPLLRARGLAAKHAALLPVVRESTSARLRRFLWSAVRSSQIPRRFPLPLVRRSGVRRSFR
ncbi:MAG: hypothetical protein D6725_16420 [Planctomycetota bacterium]|nr:MAG: hypothetical protein D6725_16420 [Planctomycetota bacterium]